MIAPTNSIKQFWMMKEALKEHFARMVLMCKAFKNFANKESLFWPEYVASKYINEIVAQCEFPRKDDMERIREMMINTESIPHYNGSAWYDYKIHLNFLLRSYDFQDFDIGFIASPQK